MRERDESLDVAKGILAIFVVYGHVFTGGRLYSFIYTFHIPAFFMITGVLIGLTEEHLRSPRDMLTRNLLTIGIPYVFFEILGGITYYLRFGYGQTPVGLAYNSAIMHCNNGPDWFLYVLLISKCLFLLFIKSIMRLRKPGIWLGVYCSVAMLFAIMGIRIPGDHWVIAIARKVAVAHGYILIGFAGRKLFCTKQTVAGIIACMATVIISLINKFPDMSRLNFGNPALYMIGALFGSYAVLQLSKLVKSRILSYYGKGSLIVMGTHVPILFLIRHVLSVDEFPLWEGLAVICVIMMIEYPTIYLIQNYMPWVIGKRKMNKR